MVIIEQKKALRKEKDIQYTFNLLKRFALTKSS